MRCTASAARWRLGAIKPRAVLAVLLLHANEPVSAERLALALWGEDAPADATRTVQVYVSRLRTALGEPEAIATTPAGYRLRVRPGELDAERFARGVEAGRRALAAGQPERAAALLREALGLWRGPPLAELEFEPFAQVEIARLEEQRLAALEARVEADLAAGRHAELVASCSVWSPSTRRASACARQLMLALYRAGARPRRWRSTATRARVLVERARDRAGARAAAPAAGRADQTHPGAAATAAGSRHWGRGGARLARPPARQSRCRAAEPDDRSRARDRRGRGAAAGRARCGC